MAARLPPHDVDSPDRLVRVSFAPVAERRSVLDRAHRGDIEGAFGRLPAVDISRRPSLRRRLATLLAIMGPGIVVMVADNDAGGLSLYAQGGQDHGLRLIWLLLFLAPVLFVIQEMVARLGAVTGAGHARLIFERFGRRWGTFALIDLLALNLLTIVTEFIGVALGLGYFGVSRYVSVPVAAAGLVAVTITGSFRRWERAMYVFVAASLVAVPLLAVAGVHHSSGAITAGRSFTRPGDESPLLFVIALVGTTVAPWQLFFQQSNVVDKRITPRWLHYERIDTAIGAALFTVGALAVVAACAIALSPQGAFVDAGQTGRDLAASAGPWAGALFALALVNGSVLGAAAVTLATSYAIGDVFGTKHSLHRRHRDAPVFHGTFVASVAIAAAVVLIPGTPLGVATVGVQVLAGILLPSATVFLLLLCNDEAVLGPHVNPRWLNAIACTVVASLIALSALLTFSTLFPASAVSLAAPLLAAGAVSGTVWAAVAMTRQRRRPRTLLQDWERSTWTTPQLASLPPPSRAAGRTLALMVLRLYLSLAFVSAVVKIGRIMAHA
jgi:Mn2+/Fe2+ NRAMP family transporter